MYSQTPDFVCSYSWQILVYANILYKYLSICNSGCKLEKMPENNMYKLEVTALNNANDKVKALNDNYWQNFGRRKGRGSKETRKSESISNHFLYV